MVSKQKYPDSILTTFVTLVFWCIKVSNLFLCSWKLTEASSKVLRNPIKIFKKYLLEEFCAMDVQMLCGDGGSSETEPVSVLYIYIHRKIKRGSYI